MITESIKARHININLLRLLPQHLAWGLFSCLASWYRSLTTWAFNTTFSNTSSMPTTSRNQGAKTGRDNREKSWTYHDELKRIALLISSNLRMEFRYLPAFSGDPLAGNFPTISLANPLLGRLPQSTNRAAFERDFACFEVITTFNDWLKGQHHLLAR